MLLPGGPDPPTHLPRVWAEAVARGGAEGLAGRGFRLLSSYIAADSKGIVH